MIVQLIVEGTQCDFNTTLSQSHHLICHERWVRGFKTLSNALTLHGAPTLSLFLGEKKSHIALNKRVWICKESDSWEVHGVCKWHLADDDIPLVVLK